MGMEEWEEEEEEGDNSHVMGRKGIPQGSQQLLATHSCSLGKENE